jgi:lipoate-protein ligase A
VVTKLFARGIRVAWEIDVAGDRAPWWNMALDRWLLRQCESGRDIPVLRLYGWDRPTVTVGRHQDLARDRIDTEACRRHGVSVVRRPTGGRAVYHGRGLTYAVVAPIPRGATTVVAIYHWVAQALVDGLQALGLPVAALGRQRGLAAGPLSAACYAAPSEGEVALAGRKWVGSAQRRLKCAFLQHGSIPLEDDSMALAESLRFATPEGRREWATALAGRTAQLDKRLAGVTRDDLCAAIQGGFERCHGVGEWVDLDTTAADLADAVAAYRADPYWTPVP